MPGVDRLDGLFRLKLRAQPCIQDVWRCQVQRGCHDKSGRWNWEATNPTLSIICLTKMLRCWLPQWLHGSNWRKSIRKLCRLTPSIPRVPAIWPRGELAAMNKKKIEVLMQMKSWNKCKFQRSYEAGSSAFQAVLQEIEAAGHPGKTTDRRHIGDHRRYVPAVLPTSANCVDL